MAQYLKQYGEALVDLGYLIVPLPPGSKAPLKKGWSKLRADRAQIKAWYENGSAQDGVGVLAATAPAIDVDILDEEAAEEMSRVLDEMFPSEHLLTRTGLAPKFLVPFRCEKPFRKISSCVYTDGTHDHRVEVLGDGQQWVAYHIHPQTRKAYAWWDGISNQGIAQVPRNELPLLDPGIAQQVVDAFEALAMLRVASGVWRLKTKSHTVSSPLDSDPFSAYADPVPNLSRTRIEALIERLDPDSRDDWVRAGRILHHQYKADPEGFQIWSTWAQKSGKWEAESEARVWASFGQRSDAPETIRSLIKEFGAPAPPTQQGFRFYDGDTYSKDFALSPEIIEDVLPAQGVAMMFGPSGKGKTFWMLDLAFHIHNGIQWRDKDTLKGDVMYVAAEAGRGIKKRIQAVKKLHPEWTPPFIADAAPNLSHLESIVEITDAAKAVGKPSLLIIDTMSASFEGDDSSQQDVAKMMRNLKILSDELRCLVVFVHHTTKEGGSWRGSGVLFADVDAVLELVSEGEGAERRQWVTQRKHREGEDGRSYPFSLKVSEPLGHKPNGKAIVSCTVEHEDYAPVQKKTVKEKKSTGGEFETSDKYGKARDYLRIIREELGLSLDANIDEADVIAAVQKDEKANPYQEPDYPRGDNVKRTLLTLAEKGKIRREGRWIRLCE